MKNTKGFSLVEVMVAGAISVAALAAVMTFFTQSTRTAYEAEQKYKLSTISRSITSELMETAALANLIVLYKSSAVTHRDAASDRLEIDTAPTPWLRPSGDLALFVFFESPKRNEFQYHRIKRIVGYYAVARPDNGRSFRRIDMNFSTPLSVPATSAINLNYLEEILAAQWSTQGVVKILHDNVRGLSRDEVDLTDATPRIFYYNDFRTVTLNMQLFSSGSGANNVNSGDKRTLSTSINFTLTPRT